MGTRARTQTEEKMRTRTKLIVGGIATAAVIGVGTGVGVAALGDDEALRGAAYERATAAALAHVGEGTVTEAESEGAGYEVGIRLQNGRETEVQLDAHFEVTQSGTDDEEGNDTEEDD
jgi:hypothetical protein